MTLKYLWQELPQMGCKWLRIFPGKCPPVLPQGSVSSRVRPVQWGFLNSPFLSFWRGFATMKVPPSILGKIQAPWEVQGLQPLSSAFPCPSAVPCVSLLLHTCTDTWPFQLQCALPQSTKAVHNGFQMHSQVLLFFPSDRRF